MCRINSILTIIVFNINIIFVMFLLLWWRRLAADENNCFIYSQQLKISQKALFLWRKHHDRSLACVRCSKVGFPKTRTNRYERFCLRFKVLMRIFRLNKQNPAVAYVCALGAEKPESRWEFHHFFILKWHFPPVAGLMLYSELFTSWIWTCSELRCEHQRTNHRKIISAWR